MMVPSLVMFLSVSINGAAVVETDKNMTSEGNIIVTGPVGHLLTDTTPLATTIDPFSDRNPNNQITYSGTTSGIANKYYGPGTFPPGTTPPDPSQTLPASAYITWH